MTKNEAKMLRKSLKFKATLLVVLITAVVVVATALEIFLDYRDTEQRSYETATDITRVVERQTRDTITYVDHSLEAVSNLLRAPGGLAAIRQPNTWKVLRAYCTTLIGCNAIGVIDANGKVITQTRNIDADIHDVLDRVYFQRAKASGGRYIDTAIVSRLPGSPILFTISKPVYSPQGELLAVVAIGMETSQLTSFYSLFGFSVAPTVAVYKGDGGLVARNPGMDKYVGRSNAKSKIFTTLLPIAPFGPFDSLSPIDGKRRLAAYRSLPDLDLVIFSGIERPAAFAPWKARTMRRLAIVAGVLLLTWSALFAAYRVIAEQSLLRKENRYLDDLVFRDPLTGIGNRRLFEQTLKRDWGKHCRSGASLSVVLIDVDYFKSFNDHYGHQAGDECLRAVADALQESLHREGDLVARYGGEEFVAVLDCDHEGAALMAERMRHQIESLQIHHACSEISSVVTASFGVASTQNTRMQNAETLLAAADDALYAAKKSGRNKVLSAEASSSHLIATTRNT